MQAAPTGWIVIVARDRFFGGLFGIHYGTSMWQDSQSEYGFIDRGPIGSYTVPTTPAPLASRQQVVMRPSASTTAAPARRYSHTTSPFRIRTGQLSWPAQSKDSVIKETLQPARIPACSAAIIACAARSGLCRLTKISGL